MLPNFTRENWTLCREDRIEQDLQDFGESVEKRARERTRLADAVASYVIRCAMKAIHAPAWRR
jgi:hypothetical protein